MEYLGAVKRSQRTGSWWLLIAILAGARLACAEVAESKANDYQIIMVRNPFGLKDPPPPPSPDSTSAAPVKVDVKFTGITAHSDGKKAWLQIPAQPGKSTVPRNLCLAEGEKDGDLQVLEIDEKETTVKILNAGVPVVLNFRENGLAAPTALAIPGPSSGPVPGMKTAPGNPAAAPGAAYLPPAAAGAQPHAAAGTNPGSRTIPSRNLRTTPVDAATSTTPPAVDPAVQYIQMKAAEQLANQKGLPHPPLPPVPGLSE